MKCQLIASLLCLLLVSCNPEEKSTSLDLSSRSTIETVQNDEIPQSDVPRKSDDTPQPHEAIYPPAPELPPAPDTIKIAVISDINSSYGTVGYMPQVKAAVQDIVTRGYDFVISPGDLVAGQKNGLDYDAMWKAFHYQVDDVFFDNNLEFIFAPGNHDASAFAQFEPERAAFAHAFENRRPREPLYAGSQFPFYYGLTLRDIRIIVLDITRPISNRDPQLDWLENILQSPQKPRATIVLGHLPLAPINLAQFWDIAGSSRLLEILQKSPNTLYISGHHHAYYPGHIGNLRTIACPALGVNPRKLMGQPAVGGYLQIVIPPEAPPRVYALIGPDFKRMIDNKALPQNISKMQREDLGMADYTVDMLDDQAQLKTQR